MAFRAWLIASGSVYVTRSYVILALPAILVATALVSYLFTGLLGNALPDSQREWLARLSGYLLAFAAVTAIVLGLVLEGPAIVSLLLHGLQQPAWKTKILAAVLPGGWLFVVVLGLLGGKSAKSPSTTAYTSSRSLEFVVGIAPPIFLAGLLMLLSWGTDALVFGAMGSLTDHPSLILWVMATALAGLLAWRLDVNEFSMNLFYRNRLVRTFLGASNETRKPSLFTGFASDDDIALQDLTFANSFQGPYPIWGTTLNLTAGEDLAWQQRKGVFCSSIRLCSAVGTMSVSSKTAQPESPAMDDDTEAVKRPTDGNLYGYRRTGSSKRRTRLRRNWRHPYIGTAMAASGAAASPNMGFHTKPGVAALLAIFNVRLGFWTGNPRNPRTWGSRAPGICILSPSCWAVPAPTTITSISPMAATLKIWALYELVRRRVRFIICSDADADPTFTFGDLAKPWNAAAPILASRYASRRNST